MKRHLALVNPLLIFFFLCGTGLSSTFAQRLLLRGRVLDDSLQIPIAGATVTLRHPMLRATTDSSGVFFFEVLHSGQYRVEVRHVAYGTSMMNVHVEPDTDSGITVFLHPTLLPSDEIIVHATRMNEEMLRSPYPVAVVMDDRLEHSGTVTLPEALANVPGLSLVRDGTWETALSIRGLSRADVVTLVDNVRIETATDLAGPLSLINRHDLERVEVLKSPASSLHGTGAFGGVIQMITKRPSYSDHTVISGEYATDASSVDAGTAQFLALNTSGPDCALRLSAGIQNGGNTSTPIGPLANSQYHDFSIATSLAVQPFLGQSLLATYQRVQAENTGIPGGAPFPAAATATYTLARRELFCLDYAWTNPSATISSVTARASRQEIDRNVTLVQSPSVTVTPHASHITTGGQADITLIPLTNVSVVGGCDVWKRELDSQREKYNFASHMTVGDRPIPISSYLSAGAFLRTEWECIPDNTTIMAGGRHDWIHIRNEQVYSPEYVLSSGAAVTPTPGQLLVWNSGATTDQSWSADVGLRQELGPVLDVTGLVSAAFRSPTLEERFQYIDLGSAVYLGNPTLKPERSVAANFGATLHPQQVRVRADVFMNTLTNLVVDNPSTFEGRPAYIKGNVGRARLLGCELESEWEMLPWGVWTGTLAYVRGEDGTTGAPLPQISPLNGRVQFSAIARGLGSMDVGASWALEQQRLAAGEQRTAGYGILDVDIVSAPIPLGRFLVALHGGVHNLLNAEYRYHLSTLRGRVTCEPGRNVIVSATINV